MSPAAAAATAAAAPWSSLKLAQLRLLLSQIGSATSGTKPVLVSRLARALRVPIVPVPAVAGNGMTGVTRVLSIDMGIRNLAYCVVDVWSDSGSGSSSSSSRGSGYSLSIREWKRVNVLSKTVSIKQESSSSSSSSSSEDEDVADNEEEKEVEAYSPAQLAPAAVDLVRNTFLPTRPTLIAIERQRFRSGGGSAVLEWTLRVNMLEGMLWSALKSMLSESAMRQQEPESTTSIVGVSPARVARFWVPKVAGAKAVIEKKQKVEVVRRWLGGGTPDGLSVMTGERAVETRDMVMTGRVKGVEKVDDLADCLLQAGALTMWERNRRMIMSMGQEELLQYCLQTTDHAPDDKT